jgi:hypothetical protein
MAPLTLRLFIPIRLQSPGNLRDPHWSDRHKRVRRHRDATAAVVHAADARSGTFRRLRDEAAKGAHLTIVFFGLVPRFLDSDGYIGSIKSVRDELAQLLGISDGPEAGHEWKYWPQGKEPDKGKQGLWVTVEVQR